MSVVLDYLVKISAEQAAKIVEKIAHEKLIVQMKIFGSDDVHAVKLYPSLKKQHYIVQFKGNNFDENMSLTFKVDLGLKLYFFKTEGQVDSKTIILNKSVYIYELVRWCEPRYKVPSSWQQFAIIFSSAQKNFKSLAKISEISYSGMRLTLTPDLPRFELNQKVKIQFKIYKRAQVAVLGTVRHLRKNKSGGPTLGIEFNEMSELVKGKIQNICDDIGYHQAHHALDL
jgi:hypothetical protein